tara:strand:- start:687 stop:1055 length:369 start_codon:yes stop_codon:yes gene_type:complete
MWIDSENNLYFGDCAQGDREATLEEMAAWEQSRLPIPPTPLEQIRALERQYADDTAKITRQTLLMATVATAQARPEAAALTAGMTQEEAKATVTAYLVATDPGFKRMFELEQAIEPLRAQIL